MVRGRGLLSVAKSAYGGLEVPRRRLWMPTRPALRNAGGCGCCTPTPTPTPTCTCSPCDIPQTSLTLSWATTGTGCVGSGSVTLAYGGSCAPVGIGIWSSGCFLFCTNPAVGSVSLTASFGCCDSSSAIGLKLLIWSGTTCFGDPQASCCGAEPSMAATSCCPGGSIIGLTATSYTCSPFSIAFSDSFCFGGSFPTFTITS
jgi:hypothetical protein